MDQAQPPQPPETQLGISDSDVSWIKTQVDIFSQTANPDADFSDWQAKMLPRFSRRFIGFSLAHKIPLLGGKLKGPLEYASYYYGQKINTQTADQPGKDIVWGNEETNSSSKRISWGDDTTNNPDREIIWGNDSESQPPIDNLVLPTKDIRNLSTILQTCSSGGSYCVPISYAYMQMIKNPDLLLGEQESLVASVCAVTRGEWKDAKFFTRSSDDINEINMSSTQDIDHYTDWLEVNKLIYLLSADQGSIVESRDDVNPLVMGRKNNRSVIINTTKQLPSEIIYIDKKNPYWDTINENPYDIGDHHDTAGRHALLAVDYEEADGNKYIYMIDPQIAALIKVDVQDITNQLDQAKNEVGEGAASMNFLTGTASI